MRYVAVYYQKGQFHQIIEEGIQKKAEIEEIKKRPGVVDVVPVKKEETYKLIRKEREKVTEKIKDFYGNDKGLYQNALNLLGSHSNMTYDIYFDDDYLHFGDPDCDVYLTLHKDGAFVFTYECDVITEGRIERQTRRILGVVDRNAKSYSDAAHELETKMHFCGVHFMYLPEQKTFIEFRKHWR